MNAKELGLPKGYQVLEQDYSTNMSQMRKAGLTAWSPADVMRHQNKVVGTEYQDVAWDNSFFTNCGIAGSADKVYLDPKSRLLRAATPQTQLVDNGLSLTEKQLQRMTQYSREDMIFDRALTEEEARAHIGWLALAEGNQDLLDKRVENAFRLGRYQFEYNKMMGFYVPEDLTLRPLVISYLRDMSGAGGYGDMYRGKGYLVGSSRRGERSEPTPSARKIGNHLIRISKKYYSSRSARIR